MNAKTSFEYVQIGGHGDEGKQIYNGKRAFGHPRIGAGSEEAQKWKSLKI